MVRRFVKGIRVGVTQSATPAQNKDGAHVMTIEWMLLVIEVAIVVVKFALLATK